MHSILVFVGLCSIATHTFAQDGIASGFRVIRAYPHDPDAFTQGLLYHDGFLYESTGRKGKSTLRKVDLESGDVIESVRLNDDLFAEGLALVEGKLIQLTWEAGKAFVYDLETLQREREFEYSGMGWGLTYDGQHLIKSDGSNILTFLDPSDFQEVRRVRVRTPAGPVYDLNELEYVNGEVWANVWHTDFIVRIDPGTGAVLGVIDLSNLMPPVFSIEDPEAVLNGIAFDITTERLFVTGKLWPRLFEITVE